MGILYLVRHGETEWNRQQRLQGWVNTHLNSRGWEQAARVSSFLATQHVGCLYTSPFIRARAMADIAAQVVGLRPKALWILREMSFGAWEGKSVEELDLLCRGFKERWLHDPYQIIFPGGDSFFTTDQRAREALDLLSKDSKDNSTDNKGTSIAAFTHGQFIRSIMCLLFKIEPSKRNQIPLKNGSISAIRFEDGKITPLYANYTDHLL